MRRLTRSTPSETTAVPTPRNLRTNDPDYPYQLTLSASQSAIGAFLWWGATDGAVGSHLAASCARDPGAYGHSGMLTAQSVGTIRKDGHAPSGRPVGRSYKPCMDKAHALAAWARSWMPRTVNCRWTLPAAAGVHGHLFLRREEDDRAASNHVSRRCTGHREVVILPEDGASET
jgi:hypothetical protein